MPIRQLEGCRMTTGTVTIGNKIKLGYALLTLLLLGILVVGMRSLSHSSDGFTEYRTLAVHANLVGQIQANLLAARTEVKEFMIHPTDEHKVKFHDRWKKMEQFVNEAKTEITDPEHAKLIEEIHANAGQYESSFDALAESIETENTALSKTLDVRGPEIEHALTALSNAAVQDHQIEEGLAAASAERTLLIARLYVNKYLISSSEEHAARVRKEFDATWAALNALKPTLKNPERQKLCATALEHMKVYGEQWNVLHKARQDRNNLLENNLNKIGPQITEDAEVVKLSILKSQNELGPRLIAANSSASYFILLIGIGAFAAAVLFGWLITRSINRSLNTVAEKLSLSSADVSSAAVQVSSSSQELAAGASEQASSLEETSASLEELSSMTRQNAENALNAKSMVDGVRKSAESGRVEMQTMSESIGRIKHSADETAKIVKTIDEIAFQTNLLALNAAVEAARAGDAGKGFAVVAEEVRSLAQRSAAAARTTAELIDESQRNADGGVQVTQRVAATFDRIIKDFSSMTTVVTEVSSASQEQSKGIEQINTAISQMDRITQSSAANAEECAASSQELTAQAVSQREMVHELEMLVLGVQKVASAAVPQRPRSEVIGIKESFARQAQRARRPMPRKVQQVADLSPADFE